jgi:hypothetical protein
MSSLDLGNWGQLSEQLPQVRGHGFVASASPTSSRRFCSALIVLAAPVSQSSAEVAEAIRRLLLRGGVPFEREPSVGGVRPDFLIETVSGRRLVLEAKSWSNSRESRSRATSQAGYFRKAVGADAAWIVLTSSETDVDEGVVHMAELLDRIQSWAASESLSAPKEYRPRPYLFAAMPFDPGYDDVYFVAMVPACDKCGLDCIRVDHEEFIGDISDRIHQRIANSIGVIADLSESNPNVLYEVGYARGRRLDVVPISRSSFQELPFDVRGWNTIEYRPGRTHTLQRHLAERIQAVFG